MPEIIGLMEKEAAFEGSIFIEVLQNLASEDFATSEVGLEEVHLGENIVGWLSPMEVVLCAMAYQAAEDYEAMMEKLKTTPRNELSKVEDYLLEDRQAAMNRAESLTELMWALVELRLGRLGAKNKYATGLALRRDFAVVELFEGENPYAQFEEAAEKARSRFALRNILMGMGNEDDMPDWLNDFPRD